MTHEVEKLNVKPTEYSGLNLFGASKCPKCEGKDNWHSVLLEGYLIPRMKIREWHEKIEIGLDDRFIYVFDDLPTARIGAEMAAQAMAIGEGYSNYKATSKGRVFAAEVFNIEVKE